VEIEDLCEEGDAARDHMAEALARLRHDLNGFMTQASACIARL
jgi:hypothetical protein